MENDIIILGPLLLCRKMKKNHKNTCFSVINSQILMTFSTWVVHDNYIAHGKQHSEILHHV